MKYKIAAEELSGVLNYVLEAYQGVIKRGDFTACESDVDAKKAWAMQSDQAAQFVDEVCTLNPQHETSSAEIFGRYIIWADDAGIGKRLNRNNLTSRLTRLGVETKKAGKGKRMLVGIKVGKA